MFPIIKSACLVTLLTFLTQSYAAPAADYLSGADGNYLLGSHFGQPGDRTFDYVVVGGGTAGLAIASRLAEDSNNLVAVIEAGSFYEIGNGNLSQIPTYGPAFSGKSPFDVNPLIDWAFLTAPQTVHSRCVVRVQQIANVDSRVPAINQCIMLEANALVEALLVTT